MQELILQIMISSDENVRSELTKLKYDIVAIILSIYIFFNYIRDIKGQTKKKTDVEEMSIKVVKIYHEFPLNTASPFCQHSYTQIPWIEHKHNLFF